MVDLEKNINQILKNLKDLESLTIEDLKLVIKKYPFFQTAYSILAKKLHESNNINKKYALELAAIYSPDRIQLKKYINAPKSQKRKGFEEESIDHNAFTDNIISENLAKIMIEQGKTELAIKIYKRLILKFPQKKPYFVDILNSLKTKL